MCRADDFTLQHEVELGRAGRRCLVFSMNEEKFVKNLTDGSSERGRPCVGEFSDDLEKPAGRGINAFFSRYPHL